MKARVPKTVRKTAISVVILLVLFVVAGMAYVLITDRSSAKPVSKAAPANTASPTALPKPTQPAPNAAEGVAVETVTSPVAAGSNASISISTNAGSVCTILVTYNGVPSTDSGLAAKAPDPYGGVTWTWTVGNSVPPGTWPIKVTCTYHGRSGVALSNMQVTKPGS